MAVSQRPVRWMTSLPASSRPVSALAQPDYPSLPRVSSSLPSPTTRPRPTRSLVSPSPPDPTTRPVPTLLSSCPGLLDSPALASPSPRPPLFHPRPDYPGRRNPTPSLPAADVPALRRNAPTRTRADGPCLPIPNPAPSHPVPTTRASSAPIPYNPSRLPTPSRHQPNTSRRPEPSRPQTVRPASSPPRLPSPLQACRPSALACSDHPGLPALCPPPARPGPAPSDCPCRHGPTPINPRLLRRAISRQPGPLPSDLPSLVSFSPDPSRIPTTHPTPSPRRTHPDVPTRFAPPRPAASLALSDLPTPAFTVPALPRLAKE